VHGTSLLAHHASEGDLSGESGLEHVADGSDAFLVLHASSSILTLVEVSGDAFHGSHAFGSSDDSFAVVGSRLVEVGTSNSDVFAVSEDHRLNHVSESLGLLVPGRGVFLQEFGMSGHFLSSSVSLDLLSLSVLGFSNFLGLYNLFLDVSSSCESLVGLLSLDSSSLFVSGLAEFMSSLEVGLSFLLQVSDNFFGVMDSSFSFSGLVVLFGNLCVFMSFFSVMFNNSHVFLNGLFVGSVLGSNLLFVSLLHGFLGVLDSNRFLGVLRNNHLFVSNLDRFLGVLDDDLLFVSNLDRFIGVVDNNLLVVGLFDLFLNRFLGFHCFGNLLGMSNLGLLYHLLDVVDLLFDVRSFSHFFLSGSVLTGLFKSNSSFFVVHDSLVHVVDNLFGGCDSFFSFSSMKVFGSNFHVMFLGLTVFSSSFFVYSSLFHVLGSNLLGLGSLSSFFGHSFLGTLLNVVLDRLLGFSMSFFGLVLGFFNHFLDVGSLNLDVGSLLHFFLSSGVMSSLHELFSDSFMGSGFL